MAEEPYPDIDPWDLPDQVELRLAYHLVARQNPLDRKVLYRLIARPKRYSELKPLLGKKNDHNLTVALKRLVENGLVERYTHLGKTPPVHEYELTELGTLVVLTMERIRPIHHLVEEYLTARPLGGRSSPPSD